MNTFLKILFVSFFLFFLIPSFSAPIYAQDCNDEQFFSSGLVPCGRNCNDPRTDYDETQMCNLCHLIVGMDRILDYLLFILGFIGFLMIVMGGIVYLVSAGNQNLIALAKKAIFSALAGFALVLLAWVFVNTVIVYLLPVSEESSLGIKVNGWSDYSCDSTTTGLPVTPTQPISPIIVPITPIEDLIIPENPSLLVSLESSNPVTLTAGSEKSVAFYLVEEGTDPSVLNNAGRDLQNKRLSPNAIEFSSSSSKVTYSGGTLTATEVGSDELTFSYENEDKGVEKIEKSIGVTITEGIQGDEFITAESTSCVVKEGEKTCSIKVTVTTPTEEQINKIKRTGMQASPSLFPSALANSAENIEIVDESGKKYPFNPNKTQQSFSRILYGNQENNAFIKMILYS